MGYDIYLQLGAMFYVGLTIFMFYRRKRLVFESNRYYGKMLLLLEASLLVDLICVIVRENSNMEMTPALSFWSRFYVLCMILCCESLLRYVIIIALPDNRQQQRRAKWYRISLIFMTLCLTFFPVHISKSGNQIYTQGHGIGIALLFGFYYMGSGLYFAIKYRHVLQGRFYGVIAFNVLGAASIGMQIFLKNHMLVAVAASVSLVYMYFTFENPDSMADASTGLYYRHVYHEVLKQKFYKSKPFVILAVGITNLRMIADTFDADIHNEISFQLDKFMSEVSKGKTFLYKEYAYTAILDNRKEAEEIAEKIQERFEKNWDVGSTRINLDVCGCFVSCPDIAVDINAAYEFVQHGIKLAKEKGNSTFLYVDEKAIEQLSRVASVETAIYRALDEESFEVYYQPIYCVEKKAYTSAEALLRLNDPKLGYISPDEFIPIAEENGSIVEIGAMVMDRVCRFFKEQNLPQYGIEFIEVNLSLVQCIQKDLAEQMLAIMKKYDVDPKHINLELTETAAIRSAERLVRNMNLLLEKGSSFALDDYGTGYSNINYVVSLPFHIIKLDKTIVWEYFQNEKARVVMEHVIGMIKELHFTVNSEGVETKEQAQTLIEKGVDFLQGFYFSRPIDQESFIKLLQKGNSNIEV